MKLFVHVVVAILLSTAPIWAATGEPAFTDLSPDTGVIGDWRTEAAPNLIVTVEGVTMEASVLALYDPSQSNPAYPEGRLIGMAPLRSDPEGRAMVDLSRVAPPLEPGTYLLRLEFGGTRPSVDQILVIEGLGRVTIGAVTPDGGIQGDFMTGADMLTFTGSAPAGSRMRLTANDALLLEFGTDASGNWRTLPVPWYQPGSFQLVASATLDGRTRDSAAQTLTVVFDNTVPSLLSIDPDTGTSATDGITNQTPWRLTGTRGIGDGISGYIDSILTTGGAVAGQLPLQVNHEEGGFSAFLWELGAIEGVTSFQVHVTSTGPNGVAFATERTVTVDRAPVALAVTAIGSQDGTDPSDGLAIGPRPVFVGTAEPGTLLTVTVMRNSTANDTQISMPWQGPPQSELVWTADVAVTDGTWQLQVGADLIEGEDYSLRLSATRPLSGLVTQLPDHYLTIVAPATLAWTTPAPITYGMALGAGVLAASSTLPGEISYDPPAGTMLGAGIHQLHAVFVPTDPAQPTLHTSVVLSVLPAPVTITASNASRLVGFPDPVFGYTVSGLVVGDSLAGLGVVPNLSTSATVASPVGTYPVVIAPLTIPNYAVQLVPGVLAITAPGNDAFAAALPISGYNGALESSNVAASKETGEPNHVGNAGGASLWWTWTAPEGGRFEIDTVGSSFDTVLAVYTGTLVHKLTAKGYNNNISATVVQSRVGITVVAGTTYHIAIDGVGGARGLVRLNWLLRPGNDTFANALSLGNAPSGVVTIDQSHATRDANELDHAGASAGRSMWLLWTAPATGTLVVETDGSIDTAGHEFDTVLALYTGTAINRLVRLSADDDHLDAVTSAIGAKVVAGTIYRIAVDASRTAAVTTGTVRLTWTLRSAIAD